MLARMMVMYLVGGTALIGAKHDDVGGGVGEFIGVELLVLLEKLHVGTTTDQGVYTVRIGARSIPWAETYSAA